MNNNHWDENRIWHLVLHNDKAVERAMVAIYKRQTEQEKHCADAIESNGVGFSGAHAKVGTYFANWILSGKRLTGKYLDQARIMAVHYRKQLAQIANEKMLKQLEDAKIEDEFVTKERLAIQAE